MFDYLKVCRVEVKSSTGQKFFRYWGVPMAKIGENEFAPATKTGQDGKKYDISFKVYLKNDLDKMISSSVGFPAIVHLADKRMDDTKKTPYYFITKDKNKDKVVRVNEKTGKPYFCIVLNNVDESPIACEYEFRHIEEFLEEI